MRHNTMTQQDTWPVVAIPKFHCFPLKRSLPLYVFHYLAVNLIVIMLYYNSPVLLERPGQLICWPVQ